VGSQTELTDDIGKSAVWPSLFVTGQENLYAFAVGRCMLSCLEGLSAVEHMHCQTSTTCHRKVRRSGCTQLWLCKTLYLQALDEVLLACLDNLVIFAGDVMLFAQAL